MITRRDRPEHPPRTALPAPLAAAIVLTAMAFAGPGCILPAYPPVNDLYDDDAGDDDAVGDDDAGDDDAGDDDAGDDDVGDDDVGDDDMSDDDMSDDDLGDDDLGDDDTGDDDTGGGDDPAEICANAPVISAGTYYGDNSSMIDDYGDPSACTGYTAAGFDGCYAVHLLSGQQLTADVSYAGDVQDAVLYVSTDAAAPDTSCLAGADVEYDTGHENLVYSAPSNGLYYLVVDGYYSSLGGSYTLVISL